MTAPTDFIEVPSGALCGATITLTCKGPDEERSYVIEYDSQLDPDDYISGPITWEAGDPTLSVTNATPYGRRFRFTLNGGTLNQKSGITFTIPLKSGDIRTLTCVLTIEEQGVLQTGTVPVIMGPQGQRGVTMFTGSDDPTASYVPPSGWVILSNDLYLNETSNALFRATVATDGTVSWLKIAQLGTSGRYPVLFTDAMFCKFVSGLPTSDPETAGGVWYNNGVVTGSTAGQALTSQPEYVIQRSALNFWMNSLPVADPTVAGTVWNNNGVPTVSSAGYGDTTGFIGEVISAEDWNEFLLDIPVQQSIPDTFISHLFMNNAGVLTRIEN